MKKIISVLLASMLIIGAFLCINVSAASTADAVNGVDITANIKDDGTVEVTEVWSVGYTSAADGFVRNIDFYDSENSNKMTLLQKYDSIAVTSAKANDTALKLANSGVNTYSAGMSSDGKSYDITIISPSYMTEKTYTLSYTITGAVKKKSGDANFSFVFIGNTFLSTCNNVKLTVNTPVEVQDDKLIVNEEIQGNNAVLSSKDTKSVKFDSKRVYNIFAADVTMPDDIFADGALASYSSAAQNWHSLKGVLSEVIPAIVAIIASLLILIFVLGIDRIRRKKYEKRALNTMKNDTVDVVNELPTEITACQAYKMLVPYNRAKPKSTTKKVPYIFALAVLECIENRYIAVSGENLIIGKPEHEVPAYITSVLNFLRTFGKNEDDRCIIDGEFSKKVENECAVNYDMIANYLSTFYKLVPGVKGKFFKDEKNTDLYEKSYMLKVRASKSKTKFTYSDCVNNVLGSGKAGSEGVFSMMFTSLSYDKFFRCSGDDSVSALSNAVAEMYKVYTKSK